VLINGDKGAPLFRIYLAVAIPRATLSKCFTKAAPHGTKTCKRGVRIEHPSEVINLMSAEKIAEH